ncbi:GntR family transcriptional regulator [Roseomonas gilardii subsp. gilardii]|uniref:FCD domain-containing protein n=1 Tax=Roseomonas gilardii TaxID=257708 RepID=UPI001FFADDB2|nr:FCD domain-containing protein [Roseomonas gilardii]UPG73659.1 GntR family transcriptional regulator [Roseomonas gilardii subsp. gilardii]
MPDPTRSLDLLRSQTLAGAVEEDIIRQIKAGIIVAGAKLNEADLAEAMQISRAPVREAFRSLETAGLLRFEKNRGVYIREITDEEAAELYAVRRNLDEMAGRLLAPRFTDQQASELAAMLEALEVASMSGDVDRYFPLNIAFHDRLVEMAGNKTLLGFYRQVIDRMHLLRRRGFETDSSSAASHREHLAILRALQLRDADAASRAMGQHVSNGFERTIGAKLAIGGACHGARRWKRSAQDKARTPGDSG